MCSLSLTIHRGTHQIGGVAVEVQAGNEHIIIDLGANLPGTDAAISDEELIDRMFNGRSCDAVMFTHLHGDHVGLYRHIPDGTRIFIGPTAKKIIKIVAEYTDKDSLPLIETMTRYRRGRPLGGFQNLRITPLSIDHSVPDAYMLYIEAMGKRILFTVDFRAHGIANERGQLWRTLEKYVPRRADLLVTEGTTLSRGEEMRSTVVNTERDLGQRAREIFSKHKYNFVLVSSTNLDSVMEFYHATPRGKLFLCDTYQARVMLTAMETMGKVYSQYRAEKRISLIGNLRHEQAESLMEHGKALGLCFLRANIEDAEDLVEMRERGFVMLVRPNRYGGESPFELALEAFRDEAFIIYSLWTGYLRGGIREDAGIARFMDGIPHEVLHTSGHASPEDIARLIQAVDPKMIVPMHMERAEEFSSLKPFVSLAGRVHVLMDGETLAI